MSFRRFAGWLAELSDYRPRVRTRQQVPQWGERLEERTLLSAVFTFSIEGEQLTIDDSTGTTSQDGLTVVNDLSNPERVTPARPNGLWEGYAGTGYLNLGANVGDAAFFSVDVPEAGEYDLTVRYGNGSDSDRPMNVLVNGVEQATLAFAPTTSWDNWTDTPSLTLSLAAGGNSVRLENTVANGPNIDSISVSFSDDGVEPGPRSTIAINFQDSTTPDVVGYLVDNFEGFGDRGNGLSYGWVTEASATNADGTSATPINGAAYPSIAINERTGAPFDSYDPRLTGYAHFDLGSYPERAAWEIALAQGSYEVTISIGDTGGPNDSDNQLLVEGNVVTGWQPTDTYKSQLLTTIATVNDGFLTLAAPDGTITEIQYLEIHELPDLTPGDGNPASSDYAGLSNPVAIGAAGTTPQSIAIGSGLRPDDIDPTRSFAFDVNIVDGRGGVLETSLTADTIRLYETLTATPVAFNLNTTGGFDAVIVNPTGDLKENTSYTIIVDGLLDRGSNSDPNRPPREFQKYTTTFVTGETPDVVDRDVAFVDQVLATEGGFSSVVLSPDGEKLYVSTLGGRIIRWDLDSATGGVIPGSRQELIDLVLDGSMIIGLVFDPADPNRLWVTSNEGRLDVAAEFTGRIVTVDINESDTSFTATTQIYLTGLPRSVRDHLSNSLAFRQNPDAGQSGEPDYLLYLIQGSNTAMGAPDTAWGYRPERALSAAVVEIDPTLDVSGGPLDVQTEADWTSSAATALDPLNDPNNPNNYNTDGSVAGFYNPFAEDAPVRVYSGGQRNAYDLVWHSNGLLYVPTNGSAGGANAPDDPSTAQNEGLTGIPTRNDYLFAVEEGGYYGHPNPIRGDFVLNGGNPTSGSDPAEVQDYAVGTQPDPDYRGFVFDFGRNVSPNGAAEFTSDIFGNNLLGALIVAQFSGPDNVIALTPGPGGDIISSQILRRADGSEISYKDPLDLTVDSTTGQVYMVTLDRRNGTSELVLLTPDPADADITFRNLDDAAADNRLVFSRIDTPANAQQQFRDVRDFEIANEGGAPLTISEVSIGGSDPGAFQIISGPSNGVVLAAGDSANVMIEFVGSDSANDNAAVSFEAVLTITTDDLDEGTTMIALSGLAQIQSEGGEEPTVSQIVEAFGYSTNVAQGQLANGGLVEAIGDEVLLPYLQRLDSSQPIEIIQIAAYLQQGNVARLNLHGVAGLPVTELFAQDDQEGQTLLPNQLVPGPGAGGTARGKINSDTPFGLYISVDNRPTFASWSDPEANERDPDIGSLVDDGDGHLIRFFQAKDAAGSLIAGTYIGIQDYPGGGNFDYNDHMFVIKNVEPFALTTAEDADGNGINDALESDTDGDNLVDFFDPSSMPQSGVTLQAEDSQVATIITGSQSTDTSFIQVRANQPGSNGTGYADYGDGIAGDETLQFDLSVSSGGEYDLIIRYALNGAERPLELLVNGTSQGLVSFADTDGTGNAGFQTWGTVTQRVTLFDGNNVIALTSTTNAGPNIDEISLVPASTMLTFQAEDSQVASIFTGSQSTETSFIQVKANQSDFNGTGFVDYGNGIAGGETLQFDLLNFPGGEYEMIIRYALNGADRPLELTVNATSMGLVSFPDTDGAGNAGFQTWGTVTQRVTLLPGDNGIALTSTTNAGPNIDQITLAPNADVTIRGLDEAAADDRLVFSRIDNPANAQQQFRDVREFEVLNDGVAPLTVSDISINGNNPDAFQIIAGPANGAVLAAGNVASVLVEFVGSDPVDDNAAVSFDAVLTISSDDFDEGLRTIALNGLAQIQSERGEEPTVAQIVDTFGYGTDIAQGQLANGGLVETIGDEVLMPYMQRLHSSRPIEIIQIAAYLRQGDVARLGMHSIGGAPVTELFAQDDQEGQTLLPNQLAPGPGAGDTAHGAIDSDTPFGLYISVDNRPTFASWSDPEANERDPNIASLVDEGDGHLIRFFQAKDAAGNVIEGTYIGIQDYPGGGNFDYNDHMIVIRNVQPYALTAAEDSDGNSINDALESDTDGDDLVDFFDEMIADLSVTTHGNETGPTDIVFTVTLSRINNTGMPITFDLDDLFTGTATSSDDYTAIPGNAQISIAPNASIGTFTVPVTDDGEIEVTETLIAQISNPSNVTVTIGTTSATADISDNDTPAGRISTVKVRLTDESYLHLAEVEVFDVESGSNLAL
ncbi:MAG: CBM35 domain-containing protein, partial [Planctomycetaceae bacterium]